MAKQSLHPHEPCPKLLDLLQAGSKARRRKHTLLLALACAVSHPSGLQHIGL
jgi:hypothetical protein